MQVSALSVGAKTIATGLAAIVDSGTTLDLADAATVEAFYGNVSGAKPLAGQRGLWTGASSCLLGGVQRPTVGASAVQQHSRAALHVWQAHVRGVG